MFKSQGAPTFDLHGYGNLWQTYPSTKTVTQVHNRAGVKIKPSRYRPQSRLKPYKDSWVQKAFEMKWNRQCRFLIYCGLFYCSTKYLTSAELSEAEHFKWNSQSSVEDFNKFSFCLCVDVSLLLKVHNKSTSVSYSALRMNKKMS